MPVARGGPGAMACCGRLVGMSESSAVPEFVARELAALDVSLRDDRLALLGRYLDLLLEANTRFNLTAVKDRGTAWRRHILDSLTVLPGLADLRAEARVADVGSGGGLPGIPVAIARPDLALTLIEATGKKARFLEECAAALGLANVRAVHARAETLGHDKSHRSAYEAVVCRAVGPMREMLEYTLPLVRLGGLLLAMKGPTVEAELETAADAMAVLGGGELQVVEAYPEGSPMRTVIVVLRKERPTPKGYPRSPGVARQSPL